MDLNKKLVIAGKDTNQSILETLQFALNNTQSQSIEKIREKHRLLDKLTNENKTGFASDEVQLITECCLQVLMDGATIAVLNEIAPQDLS